MVRRPHVVDGVVRNRSEDRRTCVRVNRKRITLQNNLKIELARLRSPERISNIASMQLGLVMPKSNQTIVMP